MTFHRIANAPPRPAIPADATVRLVDVLGILNKLIAVMERTAGGARDARLLRALRDEVLALERGKA